MAKNKDDVILRGKALKDLRAIKDMLVAQGDPLLASVMNRAIECIEKQPAVEAVALAYHPRPMLKDRNPYNTDVYCPECGENLSGHYGDDPLPIITCFNCGEILDPYKATTGTTGERKYNAGG